MLFCWWPVQFEREPSRKFGASYIIWQLWRKRDLNNNNRFKLVFWVSVGFFWVSLRMTAAATEKVRDFIVPSHLCCFVFLAGCMAERLKEKIVEEQKAVDVVCGPDTYRDLPRLLSINSSGHAAGKSWGHSCNILDTIREKNSFLRNWHFSSTSRKELLNSFLSLR